MRALFGNADVTAREMQGRFLQSRDKIAPAPNWADHARLAWPHKTAAHIASIAGRDERTAKRWLAGEFPLPPEVMLALINHIFGKG
jgi:hypothetical protein